ncbi:MAG TPA: aminodeoxychorismate lyase [Gammaproteobacteria bacterium]|jgi:4-amino-4-deoxychorismate lyase|nr:aminodeoxychorismate lyase [Gammaproteobacteria bacterium]HBG52571.1 aminodeoxychorismate lyase [Gammaproteobacteria bacterium]
MLSWVNGRPQDAVPVTDRGLSYGDGLFETILVASGQALGWALHMDRLARGCSALGLPPPPIDGLNADRAGLCAIGPDPAVLKIILTVGGTARGYARPDPFAWRRIVSLMPAPAWLRDDYESGIRVRWCRQLWFSDPDLAGIKHLNRLPQVRARAEWTDAGIAEGLMRDPEGRVIGGTMSNLFVIKDAVLATPNLTQCGIAGTMRARIMAIAHRLGWTVEETALSVMDCYRADELFVCNAVRGIRPIRQLESRMFRPGPVTRALQREFGFPWPIPEDAR